MLDKSGTFLRSSSDMKTRTLPLKHSMNLSPVRLVLLFIPFVLACFALVPPSRAQCPQVCDSNSDTALGDSALVNDTTGTDNAAVGFGALANNTTGDGNTAIGSGALGGNTTASYNTATGNEALSLNSGDRNTANGNFALHLNRGENNTAIGDDALANNTTGSNNIALGENAGNYNQRGNYNIDIGNIGYQGDSRVIRIGAFGVHTATFIAGISGVTVPNGVGVIIGNNGKLGTVVSSERFKEAIKPMAGASEAILALKPVTFHYKKELDPQGIPQFGLVAEQVEKIDPDLVVRDEQGKPYTVRYEAVNAMLLNEFLKEHRTVQELKKEIAALTATVQKVSAQLEASKPAPQVVNNP
jgi:hypothetical protein